MRSKRFERIIIYDEQLLKAIAFCSPIGIIILGTLQFITKFLTAEMTLIVLMIWSLIMLLFVKNV